MKKKNEREAIYMVMAVKWDWEYLKRHPKRTTIKLKKPKPNGMMWDSSPEMKRFDLWARPRSKKSGIWGPVIRERRWGWTKTKRMAFRWVKEDWFADFDEAGYYNGAIVERVDEGPHSFSHERYFFRHRPKFKKGDKHHLEEMPEPTYYKKIVGLTLG